MSIKALTSCGRSSPTWNPRQSRAIIRAAHKLSKALCEFATYIENNRPFIPNYGERYRNGERISTGFVESTVNYVVSKRMVKKQQMKWSQRGAHLLLQIRTRVLNGKWEEAFRQWYPGFRTQRQPALA